MNLMLVNNQKYARDDVVTFKLVNGDEIVAKIVEDTEDYYTIYKPTTVMPSQQGIGLIQSVFTAELEKTMLLHKQHVMLTAPAVDDIVKHYIKTTTGIETVSAGKIIT